jgi:hypothetical protein
MERIKGLELIDIPHAVISELGEMRISLSGLRDKDKSLSRLLVDLESEVKLFKID